MTRSFLGVLILLTLTVFPTGASADPRLDPSFGEGGIASNQSNGAAAAEDLAEDGFGRLVAVGGNNAEGSECSSMFVARFTSSGSTDETFGRNGIFSGPPTCETVTSIALGESGGMFLGGRNFCSGNLLLACEVVAQRLGSNGLPAKSWKYGRHPGRRSIFNGNPGPGASGLITNDVSLDARGRMLIAGKSLHGHRRGGGFIVRMNPDGKLDPTFVGTRKTESRIRGLIDLLPRGEKQGGFVSVKALGSGKILAAGDLAGRVAVYQTNNKGKPDPLFSRNGLFTADLDGKELCECSFGSAMVRDYHRRVLVAGGIVKTGSNGSYKYDPAFVRLTPFGKRDLEFGTRGVVRPPIPGFLMKAIAIQQDGKIVAVGRIQQLAAMARFMPNGSLDESFFDDGITYVPGATADNVIIDRQGRIVVSGEYATGGFQLLRYLSE